MKTDKIKIGDYNLMVFDMDGTILDPNHNLREMTRSTLLRLHEIGIKFTLATGRNLPACQDTADALEIDLPLILNNGCVLQMRNGEIIDERTLLPEITKQVIEVCEEAGQDLVIATSDTNYVKRMTQFHQLMMEYGAPGLTAIGDWGSLDGILKHVNKCVAVDRESRQNLIDLEKRYREQLGEQVDYVHTLTEMLEVMPKGVNKASALDTLTNYLGINLTEVMAFGDGDNDIEMLAEAGLGVVVSNASERAKQKADITILSNEQEGVARFLESLLETEFDK